LCFANSVQTVDIDRKEEERTKSLAEKQQTKPETEFGSGNSKLEAMNDAFCNPFRIFSMFAN
jgi:hypothetical protein